MAQPQLDPIEIAEMLIKAGIALDGLRAFGNRYGLQNCGQLARLKDALVDRMAGLLADPKPSPAEIAPKPKCRPPHWLRIDPLTLANIRKTRPAIGNAIAELAHLSEPLRAAIVSDLLNSLSPRRRAQVLSR